jgi:GTP-binding protein
VEDFHAILRELGAFSPELARHPQVLVANKTDLPGTEARHRQVEELARAKGVPFFAVSAVTGEGLAELMRDAADRLEQERWARAAS